MDNYLEISLKHHGKQLEDWLTEEKTEETDEILQLAATLLAHDLEELLESVAEVATERASTDNKV